VRIKVDEDLPLAVAAVLRRAGHDVATVSDQGWTGWTDSRLWASVKAEERILVTADKGLADVRRVRPSTTRAGIVLFRLEHESWKGYRALAKRLVASVDLDALRGAVSVVTRRGIRIRRCR
jgi:predicted nuclease of predicted toxin-antitoxin system